MRAAWTLLLVALLAPAFGQVAPAAAPAPTTPATAKAAPEADKDYKPSPSDLKQARAAYKRAEKLDREGKFDQALQLLDDAVKFDPENREYLQSREMLKQRLVSQHIERGNALMTANKPVEAGAEFRQALALDPTNDFALQRLSDALPSVARVPIKPDVPSPAIRVVSQSAPIVLRPTEGVRDITFKGQTRQLLEEVTKQFGIRAIFDESVTGRQTKFEVTGVDFYTALDQANRIAKTFWIPLSPKEVIFAADNPEQRRRFERMETRTFYMTDASGPQELNDYVNTLRTILEMRFVTAQPGTSSIVLRAPALQLHAAERLLTTLSSRRPQVIFDLQLFQIDHTLMRDIGVDLPLSFQAINIPAAALALLGQGNINDLVNQLFSSGGINQTNTTALQALLAQLQNQQNSTIQQLLNTPFATFGGGISKFALTVPPAGAHLQLNESSVQTLQRLTLRTAQNNAATFRLGTRYPILNASFAPIFNTPAISQVLQNGSFQAPFPSFTYEDIGITMKATPQIQAGNIVTVKLELQIKALAGQSINNVPILTNREYTASMSLADGEPAVIVGMISQSEQKALSGLPLLSYLPGLGRATSSATRDVSEDELLVVLTPHIVSPGHSLNDSDEIWLGYAK